MRLHSGHTTWAASTVWVAVGLMIVTGVGYRAAAGRLSGLAGSVVLARGTLNALPLQIGPWNGSDVALDERIVKATDTDDHVSRRYVRSDGRGEVSLFIAYGVRFRDLMPHRPEVCYTGAGWSLEETSEHALTIEDEVELPCLVHRFGHGGLGSRSVTVLNYYIIDGQFCKDVSLLRSHAWHLETDVRYVVQVQIASSGRGLRNRATEIVSAFAADSAPAIRRTLEDAVEKAMAGVSR
ncbi:MAG: EpsI family protein [Planctomycetes bacterium]|nr:EpsI family protein [Planctomycetota bacterium]